MSTRTGMVPIEGSPQTERQSAERTPRSPNHASSADPVGELVGVVRAVGVGERVAADALGDADDGVGEHLPVLVGAVDLDERADRGGGVGEHAVDDVGELGVVAGRGAEEQPERGAVVLDEAEVGGEALLDPGAPGLDARWWPRSSTSSSRPPTSSSTATNSARFDGKCW